MYSRKDSHLLGIKKTPQSLDTKLGRSFAD